MSFLRAKSPEAPRITIADPVIVLKVSILPSLARQARPGQARGQAPPRFRRFAGRPHRRFIGDMAKDQLQLLQIFEILDLGPVKEQLRCRDCRGFRDKSAENRMPKRLIRNI